MPLTNSLDVLGVVSHEACTSRPRCRPAGGRTPLPGGVRLRRLVVVHLEQRRLGSAAELSGTLGCPLRRSLGRTVGGRAGAVRCPLGCPLRAAVRRAQRRSGRWRPERRTRWRLRRSRWRSARTRWPGWPGRTGAERGAEPGGLGVGVQGQLTGAVDHREGAPEVFGRALPVVCAGDQSSQWRQPMLISRIRRPASRVTRRRSSSGSSWAARNSEAVTSI